MRAQFNSEADFVTILWPTILQGGAIAFFFVPLFTLALSGVPPEKVASATGLMNFARITAGAFGASVATTLWEDRAALHHARLVEHVDVTNPALLQAAGLLDGRAWTQLEIFTQLNRLIDREAFMLAANDIFAGSAVLFMGLAFIVWWARPDKTGTH
jgi:DHA2 family multidrug resistance protein